MQVRVLPSPLFKGKLTPPSSKSHTLRAILFAALAEGTSVIRNPLLSEDTEAMLAAASVLGANIEKESGFFKIEGTKGILFKGGKTIDAKDSGIVLRFVAALAALQEQKVMITGSKLLCEHRSVRALLKGLSDLGVKTQCLDKPGFAPFEIQGPIQTNEAYIDGRDSQPVSALLIALSMRAKKSQLFVENPGEKPWLEMTLAWLKKMGKKVEHHEYREYTIFGSEKPIDAFSYTVPVDFSSFAFPFIAAVLGGEAVSFSPIDFSDVQGDKKIIEVLEAMGATIIKNGDYCIVKKAPLLYGIDLDVNDMIDAVPILATLGCFAKGETNLYNAESARGKESDRLKTITEELRKMGAHIVESTDSLQIKPSTLQGATLFAHNDQRIAMALAVAASFAEKESIIEGFECCSKTYPEFISDFNSIGGRIEIV